MISNTRIVHVACKSPENAINKFLLASLLPPLFPVPPNHPTSRISSGISFFPTSINPQKGTFAQPRYPAINAGLSSPLLPLLSHDCSIPKQSALTMTTWRVSAGCPLSSPGRPLHLPPRGSREKMKEKFRPPAGHPRARSQPPWPPDCEGRSL